MSRTISSKSLNLITSAKTLFPLSSHPQVPRCRCAHMFFEDPHPTIYYARERTRIWGEREEELVRAYYVSWRFHAGETLGLHHQCGQGTVGGEFTGTVSPCPLHGGSALAAGELPLGVVQFSFSPVPCPPVPKACWLYLGDRAGTSDAERRTCPWFG